MLVSVDGALRPSTLSFPLSPSLLLKPERGLPIICTVKIVRLVCWLISLISQWPTRGWGVRPPLAWAH